MPANFIDLPPEVIDEIFKFLTKTNDRRRVAQVCWRFYKIIRRQSQRNDQLKLFSKGIEWAPVSVFENSTIFPFSKLYIKCEFDLTPDSDFWQLRGTQIDEIIIEDEKVNINRFLATWSAYFPNLRTLRIVKGFPEGSFIRIVNLPDLPLDIKELYIETDRLDLSTILRLQRAAPSLKRLHLAVGDAKMVPDMLEWIESVEMVTVNAENMSLATMLTNLGRLPSKVVFTALKVEAKSINGPKTLSEFLETPRVVEMLLVEWPIDTVKQTLMMELFKLLLKAKSIRNLRIFIGPEICRQHLDLLAQLPGLETIEMKTNFSLDLNPLWSTPSTAAKICSIACPYIDMLNVGGLWALTSLMITTRIPTVENLQVLSLHCPNLKELRMPNFEMNEASLLSIASLSNLEKLSLYYESKTTNRSFEQTFQFPKLKELEVHILKIDIDRLEPLIINCPNLERLFLRSNTIIDDGFDRLFRRLPYLVEITFKRLLFGRPQEKFTIKSEYFRYTTYYPAYR